jgi:hypothetical protein
MLLTNTSSLLAAHDAGSWTAQERNQTDTKAVTCTVVFSLQLLLSLAIRNAWNEFSDKTGGNIIQTGKKSVFEFRHLE